MKRQLHKALLLLLFSPISILADCTNSCQRCPATDDCPVLPQLSIRSQGRNRAHQIVGSVGHAHKHDADPWYDSPSITIAYQKTLRAKRLAQCLFGSCLQTQKDCDNGFIKIQGSDFTGDDRDPKALLADYFYLPTDFESTVKFEPRIRTIVADLDYYVDLSAWYEGMYFRMHGPITHVRSTLNMCESICATGTQDHTHGYFSANILDRDQLLNSFTQYACGATAANGKLIEDESAIDSGALTNNATGNLTTLLQPLKYGRMKYNTIKETGFADLRVEIGKRIIDEEDKHLGLNIQFAAPVGKHKNPRHLLGAPIGNGRHWELGGGAHGHWNFWCNEDESHIASLHIDANITHMFTARQRRTFDLANRPLSRYMLVMRFTPAVNKLFARTTLPYPSPNGQFAGQIAPIANISTIDVKVKTNIQTDIVAMINLQCDDAWSWDIGYNFWARSCEKITCDTHCNPYGPNICDPNQKNRWAVKGTSQVYDYETTSDGDDFDDTIALSATQNCASIKQGTDTDNSVEGFVQSTNSPNRFLAEAPSSTGDNTNISFHPIYITCCDLDLIGNRGLSHKVFTHVSYTKNYDDWKLHFGLGGSAELGKTDKCCETNTTCNDERDNHCIDCALSQWSIWTKLGIDFN